MTTEAPAAARPASLGWTAFVLLFLYTVLLGGGWAGIYFVPLRLLSLLLIAGGLLVWLGIAWRHPAWRPRSAIWPAFLVPLVALAAATALSDRPRLGVEYLAWAVLLTALYLLLARVLAWPYAQVRIGWLAAAVGLGLGVTYVAVVLGAWVEWWRLLGSVAAPPLRPSSAGLGYGNPSAVLTVQVLLTAVAYAGLGLAGHRRRAALLALTAVTLLVIVLTGSRAGWLAVAGATLLVGLGWVMAGQHRGLFGQALGDRRIRLAVWAAVGVGALVGLALLPGILERMLSGGDGGRLSYFAAAWRMFVEDPLTGHGTGTWAPLRAGYTGAGETDYYITHAHNLYLHTLAETGLLGLAAGLVVAACLAWLVLRAIRGPDPVRRRWGWWTAFGLVYLALHDGLDFYANMPSVMVLAALPVAYLDATSDRTIPVPALSAHAARLAGRAAAVGLAVLCVVSVVGLTRAEAVAVDHAQAVDHIARGEWAKAAYDARSALDQDPEVPPYQVTRALVAAHLGDWRTAERLFAEAAAFDDLPQSWLGLALARTELGRPDEEVTPAIERALRLGANQPAIAYAAGELYDRLGLAAEADDAWVAALVAQPSLAGDPSWTVDDVRAARFRSILERAMERARGPAWELPLMAGDTARALHLAAGDPLSSLIIRAWAGYGRALDVLQERTDADPMNGWLLTWAARASARAGDADAAAEYRRLARYVIVEPDVPGYDVRIGRRPSSIDPAAGTLTENYGTYLYRRPTPPDIMPGDLPRLVMDDPAEEAAAP